MKRARSSSFIMPDAKKAKYTKSRWSTAPRGQAGGNIPYKIQQTTNLGYITVTNAEVPGTYQFKLDDIPNAADVKEMFDMYRLVKVIIYFIPLNNANTVYNGASPAVVQSAGILATCKDYNDFDDSANANEVFSYQNNKFCATYEKHVRSLKPKLIAAVNDMEAPGLNFTPTNPWVPTNLGTALWAGIKYCVIPSPDNTRIKYQVLADYHFEFKNVK